ncbi:MAG TPA: cytochrome C oxidase subunit IV family protein [Rhizomicrobium sp.]|jgi:caa(3)-type oxidase subunit IV|nr:cytochrome C oxidase subunit IV family protein [Rhizomicrobium sp.]
MDESRARREIWIRPVVVWVALCLLLAATCALAYVPMGNGNLPVSLCIAAIKVALVGLVFMRLFENNPLNRLAAAAGPIWVFVMFLLLGADYFTR